MDKHSVTMKTALNIVRRILTNSRIGVLGEVEVFGTLVLAQCYKNGVEVTIRVRLQPELSIDISGSTQGDARVLEVLLESAEMTADVLRSSFDLLQVEPVKQVA
jgi:hypothetical protein